jgi:hypothetical protein
MDDRVIVRYMFYKDKSGNLREVRYVGRQVVSDSLVPWVEIPYWVSMFEKPETLPWNCTALVKEGPKSIIKIS